MPPRKAARNHRPLAYQTLEPRNLLAALPIISEFLASNDNGFVDDNGASSDWIEIYNAGDASIDLSGYTLTDDATEIDKWTFPSANLDAGSYLVVFADNDSAPGQGTDLYTGFKLGASGEHVGLYNTAGTVVSEFAAGGADYPAQFPDVSYGVRFDTGNFDQVSYFATPTPGAANTNPIAGVAQPVNSNFDAGFYDSTIQVTLTTLTPAATIRYTIDGSEPSATHGATYNGSLAIDNTTNLRAIATRSDYLLIQPDTWTYLFLDDVLEQSNDGSAPAGWPSDWGQATDYGIDPDVRNLNNSNGGDQNIKDALLAIPSWSITTDLDNLFGATGIYSNAIEDGRDWERPASVELLNPDGAPGFQVEAGLRIRGGYSRSSNNPKHSFRLFFRSEYGDGNLEYPVHGSSGTDVFEKIDLRTAQNYSWSKDGDNSNAFIIDRLNRENQGALGEAYTRSSWLHLYVNGQYFGLFETQERADANFGASYFGGTADDYDVIKPEAGPQGPRTNVATDGNFDAYDALFQQARARDTDGVTPNFINDVAYLRAQGLNPDGTPNASFDTLLDVDNLINYMTLIFQSGNIDAPISRFFGNEKLNNYFAIRNRNGDEGFRFFVHDAEHTYRNVSENRHGPFNSNEFDNEVTYFNPQWLHQQLMANDEYRIRFADSVQAALFNDGPLTTQNQLAKVDQLAAEIDSAIVAESARWGDAKTSNPLLRSDWLNAINDYKDRIGQRNPVFLNQLRNTVLGLKSNPGSSDYNQTVDAPLFPSVNAPNFLVDGMDQHGGVVNAGSEFQFAANHPVWYTIDGSDPRLVGGGVSSSAIFYDNSTNDTTVVSEGSLWKYRDTGENLGTAWRAPGFNDGFWSAGDAELGYGDGDETTVLSYGGDANNKHVTTYFRKTFNVAAGNYLPALLRLRRDDGAVVYLNGVEIVRDNLPGGQIDYDTPANQLASNDGNTWLEFSIDPSLLLEGNNTLAVEIHQRNLGSSDISFDAQLIVSESTGSPLVLNGTTTINARALAADGTWSALDQATYFLEAASQSNIRISEINYNPHSPSAAEIAAGFTDNDEFEFLELVNAHPTGTVDLSGLQFINGVTFTFGDLLLEAGERIVVVENAGAFAQRYGASIVPVGEWSGGLSNSGETIALQDASANEVMSFTYGDSGLWSVAADGNGASLALFDSVNTSTARLGKHYSWQGSVQNGGTPGTAELSPSGIVINEILAHTDAPQSDAIELYNPTQTEVNIGGWFLSDSGNNPLKFEIPTGTMLLAGQYLVFDESDFNPTPGNPSANHFALNGSGGDQVYLSQASAGTLTRFEAVADFGATFNGESLARFPNGSGRLLPSIDLTLGGENTSPKVGPLVISEVNYHPADPSAAALAAFPDVTDNDLEFIEIHNPTLQTIDLTGWRLRGEADFNFAAGSSLSPDNTLVAVTFDPSLTANAALLAAFRAEYGIGTSVTLVGPLLANLNNGFGRVALQQPDAPPAGDPTFIPHVLVDEVVYDDLAPWDATADGSGSSLTRIEAGVRGTLASNWDGASPTPGSAAMASTVQSQQLFYNNSTFDLESNSANLDDDLAVASDKRPLRTGETATFENYTSYWHGINGLMLDVTGLKGTPTLSDFEFQIGNNDDPNSWSAAPNPISISVRPGDGVGATDRISLVWADDAITNTWLQVQLLATPNTGLAADDIFYFGNVIGDTGNDPTNTTVNLLDVALTRSNQTGFILGDILNVYDFNRDRRVNLVDVSLARTNQSGFSVVNLITPGASNKNDGNKFVDDSEDDKSDQGFGVDTNSLADDQTDSDLEFDKDTSQSKLTYSPGLSDNGSSIYQGPILDSEFNSDEWKTKNGFRLIGPSESNKNGGNKFAGDSEDGKLDQAFGIDTNSFAVDQTGSESEFDKYTYQSKLTHSLGLSDNRSVTYQGHFFDSEFNANEWKTKDRFRLIGPVKPSLKLTGSGALLSRSSKTTERDDRSIDVGVKENSMDETNRFESNRFNSEAMNVTDRVFATL